jgi:hypothetical protein
MNRSWGRLDAHIHMADALRHLPDVCPHPPAVQDEIIPVAHEEITPADVKHSGLPLAPARIVLGGECTRPGDAYADRASSHPELNVHKKGPSGEI